MKQIQVQILDADTQWAPGGGYHALPYSTPSLAAVGGYIEQSIFHHLQAGRSLTINVTERF